MMSANITHSSHMERYTFLSDGALQISFLRCSIKHKVLEEVLILNTVLND